ncbi:mechanosensitive ion channel family protein [Draconibacterium sp. IB214405]|uniref:mechanosensitive ion channel family protein n=1 Tax=Draconibacterium sp. IB214405 TaxID=3097352 RepID=UPI002A0F2A9C|nr:mechanosensitive ion channel family protein [Draconibacterium sp. IB214405]MDX8340088.1 mechanosensitive ion channel family protein [Draconibacterium sp. IB214405]
MRKLGILVTLTFLFFQVLSQTAINNSKTETTTGTNDSELQAAYVVFNNDTLFPIYANLGPFTPAERAAIILERFDLVVTEFRVDEQLFNITEKNNYSIISYDNFPLTSVSDADATILGKNREALANEYLVLIRESFNEIIARSTLTYWLLRALYTLLALGGLVLIIFLINKFFKILNTKLEHYEKGLKKKRKSIFKYLVPSKTGNIFLLISKVVKFALLVLVLFLYLPFLFSFLPWTRDLADKFYGYIADPVKKIANDFVAFIPNLFSIFVIIIITRYLLKILGVVVREIETGKLKIKGFHSDWAKPTFNLVKIVIYIITAVLIVQYLPSSKAFQGVSIFVGVIFTLGSTSAIANIVAGIVITYMRPFQIGDRVKIGKTMGDVVEKNLLVTRIKTVKNEDVTIPNATIINTHLWNYTKNASQIGIILHPSVTIGYDVPAETVIKLLLEAAKNTKNLTRDFKPFVLQKSLNDFYVEYELNVYTKQPGKMAHFYSELNKSILNEFNKAGVEILSPHYSAFRDGNASTIPQNNENKPSADPVNDIIKKATGQK